MPGWSHRVRYGWVVTPPCREPEVYVVLGTGVAGRQAVAGGTAV